MSETKNVEQKASGALVLAAWVCNECGTAREQSARPLECQCCTKWNERRGLPNPEAEFGPLFDAETFAALIQEAYLRGVADGERGSILGVADLVAGVTGV